MSKISQSTTFFDGHDLGEIIDDLIMTNSSMIKSLKHYQNKLEYIGTVIKQSKESSYDETDSKYSDDRGKSIVKEHDRVMSGPISY